LRRPVTALVIACVAFAVLSIKLAFLDIVGFFAMSFPP
jgi:hypothetical protein